MKQELPLYEGGMDETLRVIKGWLAKGETGRWIATVNPEFAMEAERDEEFLKTLNKTDLNVVDGIGLVWRRRVEGKTLVARLASGFEVGCKILGGGFREEIVGGADLIDKMCQLAQKKGYTVYFLGGWKDRAHRTANYFEKRYPGLKVVGYFGGKSEGEDAETVKKIGRGRIDMLFVAYGMKKQEKWIARNLSKLNVGVAMGVGRTFDYYSGDLKRAPVGWRKMGLEWLYSLLQEPKRLRRQLALPRFIWKALLNR